MQKCFWIRFTVALSVLILFLEFSVFAEGGTLEEYMNNAEALYTKLDINEIFNLILSGVPSALVSFSKSFGISLSLITIYHVFELFKSSFSGFENIFSAISNMLLLTISLSPIFDVFFVVQAHLSALCTYMLSFIPTATILHASSGNTLSSSIGMSATGTAVALTEFISISLCLPIIKAILALTCVNLLVKKVNLLGICKMLKSFCLWMVGFSFTIFTGIISISSLLSSSADSLALKGIKYASGRLIPIAGGMISESMRTVVASASFIKSVTGVSGIVFIIYNIAPALCLIAASKIYFFILEGYCSVSGKNMLSDFLSELSTIINIILAIFLGCAVSFIIILFIFVKTTVNL